MQNTKYRPLLGLALFALFAAGLLFGIRYGDRVIRKLNLDPPTDPLPVLMYHQVVPDGAACNEMTVTVSKLRQDFQYLNDNGWTTVLPRELLDRPSLPEKIALVTFDDGYRSNYELLYPLLQEYHVKALISPIVCLTDMADEDFCTWEMYREMVSSGLVEVGSHTYALHNLENNGMDYPPGQPNGVQRREGETDEEFQSRVLDDIQKSYDRIAEETGVSPTCFAYPFGAAEPDAQALIDELFPVSLITWPDTADLADGLVRLPRWTVSMDVPLSRRLK